MDTLFDTNELINTTVYFFPVIIVIFFISFIFYTAVHDTKSLGSQAFTYSIIIILPLVLVFLYFVYSSGDSTNHSFGKEELYKGLTSTSLDSSFWNVLLILKIIFIIYIVQYLSQPDYILNVYVTYIFIFIIIVISLAIFYNILVNYLSKLEGWAGFMVNLLFFIPCLLIDLVAYIKHEFGITPNIVFILFVLELLLIIAYMTLPYIIKKLTTSKGTVLTMDPIFLDTKMPLLSSDKIPKIQRETTMDASGNTNLTGEYATTTDVKYGDYADMYYNNYAVSMWIFINPQPASTLKEQIIFEYDSTSRSHNNPKPRITYYNDSTTNKETYLIYLTTPITMNYSLAPDDDKIACRFRMTDLPRQKWNQFVINYSNNKADVFINGELRTSFDTSISLPKYNIYDHMSVGEDNGIDGAICNLVYYTHPLTNMEIVSAYNLLQFRNPPI